MVRKKTPKLAFSEILGKQIQDKNMTLQEAANIAGTTKSVVHGWICGSHPHDLQAVAKLSEKLGVPLYYLLFGNDDPICLKLESIKSVEASIRELKNSLTPDELAVICSSIFQTLLDSLSKTPKS